MPTPTTILTLSLPTLSKPEGNAGITYFVYDVLRLGDVRGPSSATWAVTGFGPNPCTALDFEGARWPGGLVQFGGKESLKQLYVGVVGDRTGEADEGFILTLSAPSGAILGINAATGSVLNDDPIGLAPVMVTAPKATAP